MANLFSNVALKGSVKNKFDLSHEKRLTCNFGELIPIYVQETLPGDSFRVRTELMIRMAPMVFPVMHRIDAYIYYFYVPNRLVWDNWEDFISGGEDGLQSPTAPYITIDNTTKSHFGKGSLHDYLGIPIMLSLGTITGSDKISCLPHAAYHLIWNEYYRDQDLQTEEDIYRSTDGSRAAFGSNSARYIKNVNFSKDYFTSARPWISKSGESFVQSTVEAHDQEVRLSSGGALAGASGLRSNSGDLTLDTTTAVFISGVQTAITDLRRAAALQQWLEINARGGSRYVEFMQNHFNVKVPDLRLFRPKFLGGGKVPISISEVVSTAANDNTTLGDTPLGELAGHGIGVGNIGFKESVDEHGFILGLMCVRPKAMYQQGYPRWAKARLNDRFDYPFKEFANIGEQEIFDWELYQAETGAVTFPYADTTFGYQSRYADWKYAHNTVHGDFRDSFDSWHLGRKFSSPPSLSSGFIAMSYANEGWSRIFNVTDTSNPTLWCMILNKVDAIRPLSYNSIPTL